MTQLQLVHEEILAFAEEARENVARFDERQEHLLTDASDPLNEIARLSGIPRRRVRRARRQRDPIYA